tara:strand:+ start:1949 stop:2128 length:180 start_codon:yes stop_codon:yes gene_type:complete
MGKKRAYPYHIESSGSAKPNRTTEQARLIGVLLKPSCSVNEILPISTFKTILVLICITL